MKFLRTFIFGTLLAILGASLALAQSSTSTSGGVSGGMASGGASYQSKALHSTRYAVSPVGNSGISGSVLISDYGNGETIVVTSLFGTKSGGNYPEHFHTGDCGSSGAIVIPLTNVSGDTGMAVTVVHTPYDQILGQNLYLNIHASPSDLGTIEACGEVGQGAQPMTGVAMPQATSGGAMSGGVSGGAVKPEEFQTLQTASYQIYPVNNSGISGVVQITEKSGGGTRITVTLKGLQPGNVYPDHLHAGDCGSGGAIVVPLQSVPQTSAGLTDSSITDSDTSFDAIMSQNLYINIHASPSDLGTILACGEVGQGANSQ